MKIRRLLPTALSALALTATSLVVASPVAQAADEYQLPKVRSAKVVYAHGNQAVVKGVYRCSGGDEGSHVWASIKQGPKISAMTLKELTNTEGTSALARAWYDTNPGGPPQGLTATCDGTWQDQLFILNREPDKGRLHDGRVFLQFCLLDNTVDPDSQEEQPGLTFKYSKPRINVQ